MEQKAPLSTDPAGLSGAWTMEQVTTVFPSAQRALFQKYHVGGCSSCGFQPTDTLTTVAFNHGLDVNEVIDHIRKSQDMEKDIEITPQETAELLRQGRIKLLDVRSPEEYEIANVAGSVLVDQALAQEIMQTWSRDTPIVTICHHGMRSLDAAAYLRGHGFLNTKSVGRTDRLVASAILNFHLQQISRKGDPLKNLSSIITDLRDLSAVVA